MLTSRNQAVLDSKGSNAYLVRVMTEASLAPDNPPADKSAPAKDPRLAEAKARAVEIAGGVPKLAAALGITPKAIYQWPYIPADRVGQIGNLTALPPHALRPDIFTPPAEPAAGAQPEAQVGSDA